jgi:hypothetical protein
MEEKECSETSDFNIKTPGKYLEEIIPYLQHGKCLKTTICCRVLTRKHYGQNHSKSSRRGEIIKMRLKEIRRVGVDWMGQKMGYSEQSRELPVSTK